jgi:hypothetical protein
MSDVKKSVPAFMIILTFVFGIINLTLVSLPTFAEEPLPIHMADISGMDLSEEEGADICSYIFSLLNVPETPFTPARKLSEDSAPRMVCISISDGSSPYRVFPGAGHGLTSALKNAVSGIPDHMTQKVSSIVVDVIDQAVFKKGWRTGLKPGINGILTDRGGFLPSQLLFSGIVDSRGRVNTRRLEGSFPGWKVPLSSDPEDHKGSSRPLIFTTSSFFSDGKKSFPLFRGHRTYSDIGEELLLRRIKTGVSYLKRSVTPSGRFDYIYRADRNVTGKGYNILRHCGTLYSMFEGYELLHDDSILEKAEGAVSYLLRQIKEKTMGGKRVALVEEWGHVKLGGNALAIVALAKYTRVTGNRQYLPLMKRLAQWMEVIQTDKGNWGVHKMAYPSGKASSFVSSYYPGEAIFSLVRLYSIDGDPRWLDMAERGAIYLITVRDGKRPDSDLPHDHWLLYGLNELCRFRSDPLYVDHSRRIADIIMSRQNRDSRYPDWDGGYYIPPGSTPTATRTEGLCAASGLMKEIGDTDTLVRYIPAIRKGIAFQLATQITEENACYFPDPQRSLGGFRKSLTDNEIRIDYVQHNLSALIGYLRILREKI